MGLTITAIRRPIFICMFVLALIFFGVMGQRNMSKELIPNIDVPYVVVTISYVGAGPDEIEQQINQVIEQNVAGVENLKTLSSTAIEGMGMIMLEFRLGTNTADAAADVRDKVAVAKRSLPDDADEPVIMKVNTSSFPIMNLALNGTLPSKELRRLADKVIKDELATINGVTEVSVNGGDEREIHIDVDANRLTAYNLSMSELSTALSLATLNVPAGTLRGDKFSYAIRSTGEFTNIDDIKQVKISNRQGQSFYLKDLATITDDIKEKTKYTRVNGKDCVMLSITKSTEGNTVAVAKDVRKMMEEMNKESLPSGAQLVMINDSSEFIDTSIFEVNKTLGEAIVIVVIIVLLFLHSIRGTFIVSIAIPTSLFATYGPISAMKFSLNTMSLLALALVIGILVDDSIVVLENIERHLRKGEEVVDAAVNGRSEIGFAAVAISLVDIVVFLPIAFMGGLVGRVMRQFGVTIAIAVGFSLLMSFTLTPMLASKWMKKESETEKELEELESRVKSGKAGFLDRVNYGFNKFMDLFKYAIEAITNAYRGVVEWTLSNKFTTLMIGMGMLFIVTQLTSPFLTPGRIALGIITIVCCVIAIFTQPDKFAPVIYTIVAVAILLTVRFPLQVSFFPDLDQGQFSITVRTPEGTSLDETDRVMRDFEKVVADIPYLQPKEVEHKEFLIYNPISWFKKEKVKLNPAYVTTVGSTSTRSVGGETGDNYAAINCYMWDKRFRPGVSIADVINGLYAKVAAISGPVNVTITAQGMGGGGSEGNGVAYKVQGSTNMDNLYAIAEQVSDAMGKIEGVTDVDISYKPGTPEKQLKIRRDKIADMGLSVSGIGSALRTAYTGNTDTKFREDGSEYDINIRYRKEDRSTVEQISDVIITNKDGRPIYAKDIADIVDGYAPNKIERESRLRKITISSNVGKGYSLGNLQTRCDEEIAKIKLPVGVTISTTGSSEDMAENFGYMLTSLTIALFLTYFLMCALFESLLTPLVIFFTIPQAMVGALLALYITGTQLNMISMIGMIMLIGLVTKNAILMCDYTNTCRQRGLTKHEALINAGCARLRPIMMTTIAMIGGMMPMAISQAPGSELRSGMAIAVIGGLCVSMFLTLLVIPVVYDIVDAIWKWVLKAPFLKGLKKADDEKEDEWSANRSEDFDPTDIA
ncbi:MAG: efflux RND transporter permease subunit [Abditibacteriota bacterium]|nr:efflux RND transporter permease subunit [Abditibacteriota bacterium]